MELTDRQNKISLLRVQIGADKNERRNKKGIETQ